MIWLILCAIAALCCLALNAHLGIRDRAALAVLTLAWPLGLLLLAVGAVLAIRDQLGDKTV